VGLEVVEGSGLKTTVAAVAELDAINELLLRVLLELLVLVGNAVSSLHGGLGGESPAGAALALVLDGADAAHVDPVDRGVAKRFDFLLNNLADLALGLVGEDGLELGLSPVGHLVVANLVGGLSGVVLLNLNVLEGEVAEAHLVLSEVGVGFAVLGDVAEESGCV